MTLLLATQTRTTNVPLLLIFVAQLSLLRLIQSSSPNTLSPFQTTVTTLLLGQTSFFALGNSNAISSIDLSNAYNGVSGYNVLMVGILLFLGNWAGPIWWACGGVVMLTPPPSVPEASADGNDGVRAWVKAERAALRESVQDRSAKLAAEQESHPTPFFSFVAILTIFTAASLLAVQAACMALRTHLFIWTVFSPKYLYAMAWSLASHLGISLGLGSIFWAARGL